MKGKTHLRLFRIEAYTAPHAGRTRTGYAMAQDAMTAVGDFAGLHPDRVIRAVWELVPPSYYTPSEPPSTENT